MHFDGRGLPYAEQRIVVEVRLHRAATLDRDLQGERLSEPVTQILFTRNAPPGPNVRSATSAKVSWNAMPIPTLGRSVLTGKASDA